MRRLHRFVRVGFDPRRDPDEKAFDAHGSCALELVERVEDDEGTGVRRAAQQVVFLVVAVDDEPRAVEPGAQREGELAGGRDVGAEPSSAKSRSTATDGNAFVPYATSASGAAAR